LQRRLDRIGHAPPPSTTANFRWGRRGG
jgi:hypothetical protein